MDNCSSHLFYSSISTFIIIRPSRFVTSKLPGTGTASWKLLPLPPTPPAGSVLEPRGKSSGVFPTLCRSSPPEFSFLPHDTPTDSIPTSSRAAAGTKLPREPASPTLSYSSILQTPAHPTDIIELFHPSIESPFQLLLVSSYHP